MTTLDDDQNGYSWAEAELRAFIEAVDASKAFRPRDSKEPIAKVKQMLPVVREILLRLDPRLADFKVGGLTGWDAAEDAAHAGIGAIKAATEVEARMGSPRGHSGLEGFHPTVQAAARKSFGNEDYTQAVSLAAEQVVQSVRAQTDRMELTGVDVWQQAFSSDEPKPDAPRLRWPGDKNNADVRTMNSGLRNLSLGLQMTVRNPSAHHPDEPESRQGALERLAALSLLATLIEQCDLVQGGEEDAGASQ